jgi:hypothetical protein
VTKIQKLEAAIAELPRQEFADLARWFDEERNRKWDRQMDEDAASGKLQKLFERMETENQGKAEIPLNEVIDDPQLS